MFRRTIAVVVLSATALVGCGSQETVEDRWAQQTQEERDSICEALNLFGEDWVRMTAEAAADDPDAVLGPEDVDVFIELAKTECGYTE